METQMTLELVVLSLVTFAQTAVMAGHGIAGLTERILCVELGVVFVALSWLAYQRSSSASREEE
jgi:hypothetical protein